jgi:hypothetical protein
MQANNQPRTTIHAKRLIAFKGDAQLISHHGEVYLYADAVATCAQHVCSLARFRHAIQNLTTDGWTITKNGTK